LIRQFIVLFASKKSPWGPNMTAAVCVKCGSIKYGAFNHCQECGLRPETEIDLGYSFALTDHYFSVDVLKQISSDMKRGALRPSLPPELEDYMREAARILIEQFGEIYGLPPPSDPVMRRRSAKFRSWDKDVIRGSPVSGLMWRAGFGWTVIALLVVASVGAIFLAGALRIAAVGVVLPISFFAIYRWRRLNKRGWPQLYYRAMLLYAEISRLEVERAERENRMFDKVDSCRALALAMIRGKWRKVSVEAMISGLVSNRGDYFVDILRQFAAEAAPKVNSETISLMAERLRSIEFGPQLLIGNVIENTFGGREAARYAIALATRKAL
jgi:hypothetical protein